jgi:hypothetical protein
MRDAEAARLAQQFADSDEGKVASKKIGDDDDELSFLKAKTYARVVNAMEQNGWAFDPRLGEASIDPNFKREYDSTISGQFQNWVADPIYSFMRGIVNGEVQLGGAFGRLGNAAAASGADALGLTNVAANARAGAQQYSAFNRYMDRKLPMSLNEQQNAWGVSALAGNAGAMVPQLALSFVVGPAGNQILTGIQEAGNAYDGLYQKAIAQGYSPTDANNLALGGSAVVGYANAVIQKYSPVQKLVGKDPIAAGVFRKLIVSMMEQGATTTAQQAVQQAMPYLANLQPLDRQNLLDSLRHIALAGYHGAFGGLGIGGLDIAKHRAGGPEHQQTPPAAPGNDAAASPDATATVTPPAPPAAPGGTGAPPPANMQEARAAQLASPENRQLLDFGYNQEAIDRMTPEKRADAIEAIQGTRIPKAPKPPAPPAEPPANMNQAREQKVEAPTPAPANVQGGTKESVEPTRPATGGPRLPRELAGAKPSYGWGTRRFELNIESDTDKALLITAQANKSKRDASYRGWLKSQGMTDAEIEAKGLELKARLKEIIRSHLDDPDATSVDVPAVKPAPANLTEARKPAPAPAEVKPAAPAAKKWTAQEVADALPDDMQDPAQKEWFINAWKLHLDKKTGTPSFEKMAEAINAGKMPPPPPKPEGAVVTKPAEGERVAFDPKDPLKDLENPITSVEQRAWFGEALQKQPDPTKWADDVRSGKLRPVPAPKTQTGIVPKQKKGTNEQQGNDLRGDDRAGRNGPERSASGRGGEGVLRDDASAQREADRHDNAGKADSGRDAEVPGAGRAGLPDERAVRPGEGDQSAPAHADRAGGGEAPAGKPAPAADSVATPHGTVPIVEDTHVRDEGGKWKDGWYFETSALESDVNAKNADGKEFLRRVAADRQFYGEKGLVIVRHVATEDQHDTMRKLIIRKGDVQLHLYRGKPDAIRDLDAGKVRELKIKSQAPLAGQDVQGRVFYAHDGGRHSTRPMASIDVDTHGQTTNARLYVEGPAGIDVTFQARDRDAAIGAAVERLRNAMQSVARDPKSSKGPAAEKVLRKLNNEFPKAAPTNLKAARAASGPVEPAPEPAGTGEKTAKSESESRDSTLAVMQQLVDLREKLKAGELAGDEKTQAEQLVDHLAAEVQKMIGLHESTFGEDASDALLEQVQAVEPEKPAQAPANMKEARQPEPAAPSYKRGDRVRFSDGSTGEVLVEVPTGIKPTSPDYQGGFWRVKIESGPRAATQKHGYIEAPASIFEHDKPAAPPANLKEAKVGLFGEPLFDAQGRRDGSLRLQGEEATPRRRKRRAAVKDRRPLPGESEKITRRFAGNTTRKRPTASTSARSRRPAPSPR